MPLITGNKRGFSIFSSAEQKIINAAREMKELPDLSALIKKKLSGAKKASSATPSETTPSGTTPREETPRGAIPPAPLSLAVSPGPSVGPANVESSREDLTLTSEWETAESSVTDGNKKISAPDSSASAASQARTESDGPPKKKKKNEKKKKKSVEEQSEPAEDAEGRETVIEKGSSHDAAARGVVDSDNSPSVPLKRKKTSAVMSRLLLPRLLLLRRFLQLRPTLLLRAVRPLRSVGSNSATAWNSSTSARLLFPSPRLNVLSLFDKLRVVVRTCPLSRTLSSRTRTSMRRGLKLW